MKWTKKYAEQIIAAMNERGAPEECPMCGRNDWTLVQGVFMHRTLEQVRAGTGSGMPCAAIACNNCGNIHWFNLVILGLWEPLK